MSEAAIDKMISEAKLESGADKPPFSEIIDAVKMEAARIEGSQRALMLVGAREAPDAGQIRRIVCLDAAGRFLDACEYEPWKVAKRLNDKDKKR